MQHSFNFNNLEENVYFLALLVNHSRMLSCSCKFIFIGHPKIRLRGQSLQLCGLELANELIIEVFLMTLHKNVFISLVINLLLP